MNDGAKLLISIGALAILAGLFWQFGGRYLPLGRLPGDIRVERQGYGFYFPLMTCLVISGALSLIAMIFRHFK